MWQIGFMIGFIIGIRIVAAYLNSRPISPPECELHKWERKEVDKDDPSMGSYLVCSVCKRLPNGDKEQGNDRV